MHMSNSCPLIALLHIYDQTRPLLEPITKYGIPAILEIIAQRTCLEVGDRTDQHPFAGRSADLIGCDLSPAMLTRFREKFPSARIARADASHLPFPAAQFDIVLTVHVMHLIPPWREALREFRRVLVPGGTYLQVSTWAPVGISASGKIRDFWRTWMRANGVDAGHLGVREQAELRAELGSLGADLTELEAVRFTYSFNLREELGRFESRVYSETWDLPDAIFDASMQELRAWVAQEFGSLDQELEDEVRFVIQIARFGN
jgi:ubiquinone/menaquinone biosynthesis C-methylase UbiE